MCGPTGIILWWNLPLPLDSLKTLTVHAAILKLRCGYQSSAWQTKVGEGAHMPPTHKET